MKMDLNKLDWAWKENKFWAVVHDLIAHPLMPLTGWSRWSRRFHGWTSNKAWPPRVPKEKLPYPRELINVTMFQRWRRNG